MSHEPHPRTDETAPGSTTSEGVRPNSELERQRAGSGMPGRPTRDPLDTSIVAEERSDTGQEGRVEVSPTETVPDDVARDAARSVYPSSAAARDPGAELRPDDPVHPSPSSSDLCRMPHGSDGDRHHAAPQRP